MARIENTYEEVLEQLKNSESKKPRTYIDRSAGKLMLALSEVDIYQLRMICTRSVERVDLMTPDMIRNLNRINDMYDNRYHQLVWKVTGPIKPMKMMEGYSKLLKEWPVLRTIYIQNKLSLDVAVTYAAMSSIFPIINISKLNERAQAQKIVNAAAAESRRVYDPEKSSILRIQAFELKENRMAVVVSFVPQMISELGRQILMRYIFKGMEIEGDSYAQFSLVANGMNDKIRKANIEFWKKQTSKLGKELFIPGERLERSGERDVKLTSSIYKQIDKTLYQEICLYARQNGISKKSIFLYVWGVLLGCYHNENKVIMALVGKQNEPPLYPVMVERNERLEMAVHKIEKQWNNVDKYGYLETEDYDEAFPADFYKHFHIQHHFLDVETMVENGELMMLTGNPGSGQISLTVNYDLFHEECRMNYIYYSDSFYEDAIERIHGLFVHMLEEILTGKIAAIDKEYFIFKDESDEIKKRKLSIAQNALAIYKTGLFKLCNSKDLLLIAEKSFQQSCVVDDELITANMPVERIGIIADGMIEENVTDKNGYIKSLRVLSRGSVIGIEALLQDTLAGSNYTVASENAQIVWIHKDDVVDLFNKKPDLWRGLLTYEHTLLEKVQRVWSME